MSVVLTGNQYACGIGVVFDGADALPSEEMSREYATASAREKSQLIQFRLQVESIQVIPATCAVGYPGFFG
jgi:hypothetical protein